MRPFRSTLLLLSLTVVGFVLFSASLFYSSVISKEQLARSAGAVTSQFDNFLPRYIFRTSAKQRESVAPFDYSKVRHRYRYAITSSVQTASYANIAMTLGYSIMKHNDLDALDIEMVLLIRTEGSDAITPQNITNLEKVGWKVRVAEDLTFDDVDIEAIRPWHRHNFNKLHLWTWTQYEKVVFVDADVICKGPIADIFKMPGDVAASPDVWWNTLVDNKFNSGVLMLRPSVSEFRVLSKAVSDPNMHRSWEADQDFLNAFYKFRYFGMPFRYNFNLVMVQYHKKEWDMLWEEAVFVHMTVRKPQSFKEQYCTFEGGCPEWEVLEYYQQVYKEMVEFHGLKDVQMVG